MTKETFQKAAALYQEISEQENRIERLKGFLYKIDNKLLEIKVSVKAKGEMGEFVYMLPEDLNDTFIEEVMKPALQEESMTLVILRNQFREL